MYSVLDGHPEPEEVAKKAAALGRTAHAITDHGSVSGHVSFEKAVKGLKAVTQFRNFHATLKDTGEQLAIKPIYGIEAYTVGDIEIRTPEASQKKNHLTLLAKNEVGYRNMLGLVTRSWTEGFYYKQSIDGRLLFEQGDGLIVLSGCESGSFMRSIERADYNRAHWIATSMRSRFGDDFYIEIQHFPHTSEKAKRAWHIAENLGIKVVLTCDSHYIEPDGWRYQQFLWSVRDGKPVDDFKIEYAYLWEPDQLLQFCQSNSPGIMWEKVFENTLEVAAKVETFSLPKAGNIQYPIEGDKIRYIYTVVSARLQELGLWSDQYQQRIVRELEVIAGKGYEDYFLVVADMIRWAKAQGIYVGPARGSSAGSLVCYGLRITEIDPIRYGLLFERFVDPTRTDQPDIDVDFEDERRKEVFQYMYEKYGRENTAAVGTFARFAAKNTLDDAAKSYRIPPQEIETVKRHLVERSTGDQRAELTIQDTLDEFPEARDVFNRYPALAIAAGCQGGIRHTGRHAAGLIVASEPIRNVAALSVTADGDRIVTLDWRDCAYLNLMKIDVLGLKELTILRYICEQIGWTLWDLYQIPMEDKATFASFDAKDFLGVFQFTGQATKGVAARLHFDSIDQVADVNALSRPGPLHAGATELYIQGKAAGEFRPILPQPQVQPFISETYGQIIYQEQVMQILRGLGGMTWAQVCEIRQIMGKSKGSEAFDSYWPSWEEGSKAAGLSSEDAKQIWECIRLMGKHSFNKSHSVAYGIIAYWSMYMKTHYPAAFYCAQLRKADAEDVVRFLSECKRKGIALAPFSYSCRDGNWHIDQQGRIAPGFTSLKGIGPKASAELAANAPFIDIADVETRCSRRIVNVATRRVLSENVGKTVEALFDLDRYLALDAWIPARVHLRDFNEYPSGAPAVIGGKVIKINKKNRVEEWKHKGKDLTKLNPNEPQDYVILTVEDEGDTTMVYVSPSIYAYNRDAIWQCEGGYMAASGKRAPGIQMITASAVSFASGEALMSLVRG